MAEEKPTDSTSQDDSENGGELDAAALDELLKSASFDNPAADTPANSGASTASADASSKGSATDGASDFKLPDFQQVMQDAQASSIDLLKDVDLDVKIELGRSSMYVEDVLKLAEGSVVELDKLAGDPVDVFVNERHCVFCIKGKKGGLIVAAHLPKPIQNQVKSGLRAKIFRFYHFF